MGENSLKRLYLSLEENGIVLNLYHFLWTKDPTTERSKTQK